MNLLSEQTIVYAGFGVALLIAVCVLSVTFIQNGGMDNCKSQAKPSSKNDKSAASNEDPAADDGEDAGDADGDPPKEAWGSEGQKKAPKPKRPRSERTEAAEPEDPDAGEPTPYDPNFKGPVALSDRSQTDIGCCGMMAGYLLIVAAIMCSVMLSGSYQAVAWGMNNSPGYSPSSLRCGEYHGHANDFTGKKYLHWPSPVGVNSSVSICVASCPSKGSTVCSTAANHGGHCWTTTWDTRATLYRCKITSCSESPAWTASECTAAKDLAMRSFPTLAIRLFADIMDGFVGMTAGVLSGILVGYSWLWLTRSKAAASVRIASGLSLTAAIVFCILILLNTGTMDTSGNTDTTAAVSSASEDRSSYATLLLGFAVLVLILVQMSMICYINKREDEASFVVREAAVAMRAIPYIMILPLFPIFIVLAVTSVWVLVLFALLSISELSVGGPILHGIAGGGLILSLLWLIEMCAVIANITTAGAICEWYWNTPGDLKVVEKRTLVNALSRGCRYGLGTVARAAFFLVFQGWIADACAAIRNAAHAKRGQPACQACCTSCCSCLFPLSEGSIKFIDSRSIIHVALHGSDWATASYMTYGLMHRNRRMTEFASLLNDRMLFLAKMLVMSIAGAVTFGMLHFSPNIYNPTGPTAVVCFVMWGVATCLTDVYATVVDSIMLCFAEDCERHDGSFMRQYYMTSGLKQLLLEDLRTSIHDVGDVESISTSDSDTDVEAEVTGQAGGDRGVLLNMDASERAQHEEMDLYAQ